MSTRAPCSAAPRPLLLQNCQPTTHPVEARMRTIDHPLPTRLDARRVLAETSRDHLLHTSVTLLLYTGIRMAEAAALTVGDYTPGARTLAVGPLRYPRTITIAPTTAAALDAELAGEEAAIGEQLLLGMRREWLYPLLRDAADRAGVTARMHDLRRAAMAAVIEGGHSPTEVGAYFGVGTSTPGDVLTGLRAGWDARIADTLEAAFAAGA